MDRLKRLEVFVAVAEVGTFVGGARRLGVSAPAVTRAITALEDHLGVKLFHRTTRSVRLTEEGTRYLADAKDVLERLRAAEDAVAGAHGAAAGRLRITAPLEFGYRHIARVLPDFLRAHPRVDVEALFNDRRVDMVDEGFEVALRIGHLPDSSLIERRIGHVRHVVCASPRYAAAAGITQPSELARADVVVSRALTPASEWRFGEHVVRLAPRFTCNTVAGAVAMVTSGWGVTRALSYQVAEELARGDLVVLLPSFEPPPIPVHLVYAGGRTASARARLFVDFLAERLAEEGALTGIVGGVAR